MFFVVGKTYRNKFGEYKVLRIGQTKLEIQYVEGGAIQVVDQGIAERIHKRIHKYTLPPRPVADPNGNERGQTVVPGKIEAVGPSTSQSRSGLDESNERMGKWQSNLMLYFTDLKAKRSALPVALPIFALEHGLNQQDIETLFKDIQQNVSLKPLGKGADLRHYLPWIVYASEIGYNYEGKEYWPTFSGQTPGWGETQKEQKSARETIWRAFIKFSSELGGARPEGKFAEAFPIIVWPISHSIIPKDLQIKLAEVLHDVRHKFEKHIFETPEGVGRLIQNNPERTNSRFKQLCQDTQLIGQISAALLLGDKEEYQGLIHPCTLQRIISNLDRHFQAKSWLNSARESANRLTLRGFLPRSVDRSLADLSKGKARKEVIDNSLATRMDIIKAEDGPWHLELVVPDFKPLLNKFPDFRESVAAYGCNVNGADLSPRPSSWLLYGPHIVALRTWPDEEDPLLHLGVDPHPFLSSLLRFDCMLPPGPIRVFKIN